MRRNLVIATVSVLLAVTLAMTTLQFRTSHNITYWNGTERKSVVSDPVIVTEWAVADAVCIAGVQCSHVRSYSTVSGLFPRNGIGRLIAAVVGVVLPLFLVYAAGFFLLRNVTRYRKTLAAGLLFIGSTLLMGPLIFFWTAIRVGELRNVFVAGIYTPIVLIDGATAVALLCVGLCLLFRSPFAQSDTTLLPSLCDCVLWRSGER